MDTSLPVLVTRLPDRSSLVRLVRAALRHEIAQVALAEGPRQAEPHTLDLQVAGRRTLALLAEPAGAPQSGGSFPLRLRPLHRAQAAQLYALLEAENISSDKPDTPVPDTIQHPPQRAGNDLGDAAPILRSMQGSAPPAVDLSGRPRAEPSGQTAPLEPPFDPKRTAPSAPWTSTAPVTPRREEVRMWSPPPRAPDDLRSTAPSALWHQHQRLAPPQPSTLPELPAVDSGPDAADGTLSVNVIFESDNEIEVDAPDGTLSVNVVFDHDLQATEAPPPASEGANAVQMIPAGDAADFFFDDALLNLPPIDDPEDVPDTDAPSDVTTTAPPSSRTAAAWLEVPESNGQPWDDDEFETLIRAPLDERRLPYATTSPPSPPHPPSSRNSSEDLTPTDTAHAAPAKQPTGGKRKKTTRRGKSETRPESSKPEKRSRPRMSDETATAVTPPVRFSPDEPDTTKRAKTAPVEGRRIAEGKYTIESLIGSGAAGAVYKATHRELRRTVAIKLLHPHYQEDPQFMKSFRSEALAASQLDHPNVMRVLDFGQEADGLVYIVMEYLYGRTLQSLLDEERRLPMDRAVEIMIQVCAALSVAHDHGIIHRDIKPDNIMLVPSRNDEGATYELVKVCDFGIASLQNTRVDDEVPSADPVIAGTPEYMSPEQAHGVEIDARSDVYACGICLYELVTGRPPFIGDQPADILFKQIQESPKPPSHIIRGLDPILEEIILRAVQKQPSKRHQSARELRVELKELVDQGAGSGDNEKDELSIVENVPVLDDPASGFPGFFIAFSSAVLRFGRFERGHPEAAQALKELQKATKAAIRGRSELTFARRDTDKAIGFCVMSGTAEIVDLRRLLGSQLYGSFGEPFVHELVRKGIASLTLREGLPDLELNYLIEMLLGPFTHEDLAKELASKPLRHMSLVFISDVIGRERKLPWKVGLCTSRLARDLRALSSVRGISLKKMREIREDLVGGVARLLTRGDEVRQFIFNADLVDESVANLRGFSSFQVAPLVIDRLLHEPCAEAATLLIEDFDRGEFDRDVLRGYLRLFAVRLVEERSPRSDAAVTELYRRSVLTDQDMPRDLTETIRASTLADALVREPSQFLRTLDMIGDPGDYERELVTLEAAMAVLARRAEASALLAAIGTLARHAKGNGKAGPRENAALRTMKSMIDKQRLMPVAHALLGGPAHQREAARQLIVLAGSSGAQALYMAREALTDAAGRAIFVSVFKETGPAGWSILTANLPRMEVRDDADVALVEDLLRAMPERPDPLLGEAVARFLAHPRLRPAALAVIVPLWGDRAKKPLLDALEFAEEPARIVAVSELRRHRAVDEHVVAVIERLLTIRGSASDELRAAAAAALADVAPPLRARAVQLLSKGVEGKRSFLASLRGDGASDDSVVVTEAMARSLLALDRAEGQRAIKARLSRADGPLRARLTAVMMS